MRARLMILALALAGCFRPDIEDGAIACGPETACPPGYECGSDNRCWIDPADAPVAIIDSHVDAPSDGGLDATRAIDGRIADAFVSRDALGGPPDATEVKPLDASLTRRDAARSCPNATCDTVLGESCSNCTEDCGVCQYCGDCDCDPTLGENLANCPSDCRVGCGDGTCSGPVETPSNCPADCANPRDPICGDDVCAQGIEDACACAADCAAGSGACCQDTGGADVCPAPPTVVCTTTP